MALAQHRVGELRRRAGRDAQQALPRRHQRIDATESAITLRLAVSTQEDGVIGRLAALDSARAPAAPVLLALVDGEALVALSLTDGKAVADPFHRTAHPVDLLRARAGQPQRLSRIERLRRRWSLSVIGTQPCARR